MPRRFPSPFPGRGLRRNLVRTRYCSKIIKSGCDSPQETLDRVLSRAGLGSRTEARRWIADGRVCVNGKKVQTPDGWVDPERDRVTFDGKPLKAAHKGLSVALQA